MSFEAMPRQELLYAIEQIANDKGIDSEIVRNAIAFAVEKIAKKKYGEEFDIRVNIDSKNGAMHLKRCFTVISDDFVNSPDYIASTMLTVAEAKKYSANPQIGDVVEDILPEPEFGRQASQMARQIITQQVRSAERGKQYEEFKDNIGDIVNCTVKRLEFGNVWVDINNGKAEGYIAKKELIPQEIKNTSAELNLDADQASRKYAKVRPDHKFRALIMEVVKADKFDKPQIFLTRTNAIFMQKLFFAEVPEIYDGIIEIKNVVRDPGSHAKIAVESNDPSKDAVGMTVGLRGIHVNAVTDECCGEKIDVIKYSEDPAEFITNAMQPLKDVKSVILDEKTHSATIIVEESNKSIAIGRNGQNVKLASQLTGWNINVNTEAEAKENSEKERLEITSLFAKVLDADATITEPLYNYGFTTVEELAYCDLSDLESVPDFTPELAAECQRLAKEYLQREEEEYFTSGRAAGASDDLLNFTAIKHSITLKLIENGVKTLTDLADLDTDELISFVGEENMSKNLCERVIMKAREIVYGITVDE